MDSNSSHRLSDPSESTSAVRPAPAREGTLRVATYNVENYLDAIAQKGRAKSAASKAKVCECIAAINPDVLAMQEMGSVEVLQELRASLKVRGVDFPHWEHVSGTDADLHVAILSKCPFTARRPHTSDSFILNGQSFRSRRGFGEVDIEVGPGCVLTLMAVHLKSRNYLPEAREADFRLAEAKLLRAKIDARFAENASTQLIVLGDFNDSSTSAVLKTVVGGGQTQLIDTHPAERGGDTPATTGPAVAASEGAWTNYYSEKDEKSRIDFVLLSPSLAAAWLPEQSFVLALPGWNIASDHRPIVVTFRL